MSDQPEQQRCGENLSKTSCWTSYDQAETLASAVVSFSREDHAKRYCCWNQNISASDNEPILSVYIFVGQSFLVMLFTGLVAKKNRMFKSCKIFTMRPSQRTPPRAVFLVFYWSTHFCRGALIGQRHINIHDPCAIHVNSSRAVFFPSNLSHRFVTSSLPSWSVFCLFGHIIK